MPRFLTLALCSLALSLPTLAAQNGSQPSSSPSAPPAPAASGAATAGTPMAPPQPQKPSPIPDPAAYVLSQFGSSFKLDPKVAPMFGDFDGDGNEDVVFFATSSRPLADREEFAYRVEDPYDEYFGSGDVSITSQFNLHFDASGRDILIVFSWRAPATANTAKNARKQRVSKFVLINTPCKTASIVKFHLKKKPLQAIETIDPTGLHSLVFWTGKRWRWSSQGMSEEEVLQNPED